MRFLTILCWTLLVLPAACRDDAHNNSEDVGGECNHAGDCSEGHYCEWSADFSNGTCTQRCSTSEDCPSRSACVSRSEGICLLECNSDDDCRETYTCMYEPSPDGSDQEVCTK